MYIKFYQNVLNDLHDVMLHHHVKYIVLKKHTYIYMYILCVQVYIIAYSIELYNVMQNKFI